MNAFEQTARSAAIEFRSGRCTIDLLAKAVFPLIKKISAAAAYKLRMDVADDLATSVWILFQTKGIKQWNEEKSIGAYLSSITRNEARALWNEQNQFAAPTFNSKGDEIDTVEEVIESASMDEQRSLTDVVGKNIAIGAIKEKLHYANKSKPEGSEGITKESEMKSTSTTMGGTSMQPFEAVAGPKMPKKKNEAKKTYSLNKDQQELTEIYQKLRDDNDMTQGTFATNLGIGSARLASYLYGRTSGVPEEIMDAARKLFNSPDHVKNRFDGKSMTSIIRSWAKKLGVKEDDDSRIAALIGINVSTVCRWRNNEARPSNIELIRYDEIVGITAEKLKKAEQAI